MSWVNICTLKNQFFSLWVIKLRRKINPPGSRIKLEGEDLPCWLAHSRWSPSLRRSWRRRHSASERGEASSTRWPSWPPLVDRDKTRNKSRKSFEKPEIFAFRPRSSKNYWPYAKMKNSYGRWVHSIKPGSLVRLSCETKPCGFYKWGINELCFAQVELCLQSLRRTNTPPIVKSTSARIVPLALSNAFGIGRYLPTLALKSQTSRTDPNSSRPKSEGCCKCKSEKCRRCIRSWAICCPWVQKHIPRLWLFETLKPCSFTELNWNWVSVVVLLKGSC